MDKRAPININDYGYFANNTQQPLEDQIVIPFNSEIGENCLTNSLYKRLFFKMAPCYAPQQHVTTCGVASSITVLNAIYTQAKLKRPMDHNSRFVDKITNEGMANFMWTEQNFFEHAGVILNQDEIMGNATNQNKEYNLGINLIKLSKTLNIILNKLKMCATAYCVEEVTESKIDEFRSLIKKTMNSRNQYLIANYNLRIQRDDLNYGHFAPIVAYDQTSDRVLLLDPWASFSSWLWIKLPEFYKSMNSLDGENYRGYIVINDTIV